MASRPISPEEPTKKHPPPIRPNAHPYAIKTTSSALLSRSNSSPHSSHHTRHHYIPSPPSRVPTGMRARHRHSSSLSSVEDVNGVRPIPAPLPPPPLASPYNSSTPKRADELGLSHRVRRAETMPSSATRAVVESYSPDQKLTFSHERDSRPELYAGLPQNPKQWSTDQLTTYLEMSFEAGDGDKHDSSLADILEYVRTCGLTGRELLRLTETDLTGTHLSNMQRIQLLERSRILRADVLRRGIVDSYHSHEITDNSNKIYSHPLHSTRGASMSVDDLRLLDSDTSRGDGALPPSPVMFLHRSNSVSDASAQRYRDLACLRMRRRGKVKGLVETWERASASGSECSASETESESEADLNSGFIMETKDSPGSSSDRFSSPQEELSRGVCSSIDAPTLSPKEPLLSSPPPLYAHTRSAFRDTEVEEEEPSVEELLALSSDTPLRGARAWEVDYGLGETVKRAPISASADASGPAPYTTEPVLSHYPQDDVHQTKNGSFRSRGTGEQRSSGSGRKSAKSKTGRRVVTAIFTGSPSSDDQTDMARVSKAYHCGASGTNEASASLESQGEQDGVLRALQESVATTRIQLEAFRLRLEKVEFDIARQEAIFMPARFSDSGHTPDLELRQRQPGAKGRAVPESSSEETLIEGSSNRDVFQSWESMTLTDVAHVIVTKTMAWLFPYGHLGVLEESQVRTDSTPGGDNGHRAPAKRNDRPPLVRMSCSIILVSFAICAAVFRRMGLGRWVRRP